MRVDRKQVGESLEMQNQCAEIKVRAERRGGEILETQKKNLGGKSEQESYRLHDVTGITPKLSDLGITKIQSSRWQAIAAIPEEVFEEHIAEVKDKPATATRNGVINDTTQSTLIKQYEAEQEKKMT